MKTLKAPSFQSLKANPLPPAFGVLVLVLMLFFVLVLGGLKGSQADEHREADEPRESEEHQEALESDDPFEAFRASRMALPETTPPDTLVAVGDDLVMGPVPPQRLFREEQADLNDDGRRETYSLRNGRLTVTDHKDHLLWLSPEEWWIDDFFFGDITNDGQQNLCLSVWREGSYGPYKPFWVEANDSLVRNHLFLYHMEANEESTSEKPSLKALWQSSHLARPNHQAFIAQIDGDGVNHLLVVQGDRDSSVIFMEDQCFSCYLFTSKIDPSFLYPSFS